MRIMGIIRRLRQASMQTSALLASTSLSNSIRRGARFGLIWATSLMLPASGMLLGLLIAGVILAFLKGDPLDEVGEVVGKLVGYLVAVFAVACAVAIVCGVAFAEYVRLVVRRS